MSAPRPRIALAGATGNLGRPILQALLEANYPVTVLSRVGGNSSSLEPHPNLTIKEVDFTSVSSLTPALVGAEVAICSTATYALSLQCPLIDAAVAAGVRRFIPADFGMDSVNAKTKEDLPVSKHKARTQAYLNEKSEQSGGRFTWTAIANGWFLDWVLQTTTLLMDPKAHTSTLINGGEVRFSATLISDIAKAVIGIIEHQDAPEMRNKLIYIHSTVVTQKQLLWYATKKDGQEWTTSEIGTKELLEEIRGCMERGDEAGAMRPSLWIGCGDKGYGCDYTGRTCNALLGIKEMREEDVRSLVQGMFEEKQQQQAGGVAAVKSSRVGIIRQLQRWLKKVKQILFG